MQCEDCPNRQTREMEPTVFVSRVVIATSQGFRFQFRSLSGGPNIRRLEKCTHFRHVSSQRGVETWKPWCL